MANYYDLETDLDVEDVATEDEYDDYDDYDEDYDEQYDQPNEFGNYNPEEADEKWGSMDFDQLVVELESIIAKSKRYFFSKKKRVINGEDLTQLAQHIQNKLPTEIVTAKDIIARQVSIIDEANKEKKNILDAAHQEEHETVNKAKTYYSDTIKKAQSDAAEIIARAEEQAVSMVHESTIYKRATDEAAALKEATEREVQALIAKTREECNAYRNEAKQYVSDLSEQARVFITNGLAGYQSVAMSHLDQIESVNKQFIAEYSTLAKVLGIDR